MNTDQLIPLFVNSPNKRGTSTHFFLKDRALWWRLGGQYVPLMSNHDAFIVDYQYSTRDEKGAYLGDSYTALGGTSRKTRQHADMLQRRTREIWVTQRLAAGTPAVVLNVSYPTLDWKGPRVPLRMLPGTACPTPSAKELNLVLKGVPSNGVYRKDFLGEGWENSLQPHINQLVKVLSHGAIFKQNNTTNLSVRLKQVKAELDRVFATAQDWMDKCEREYYHPHLPPDKASDFTFPISRWAETLNSTAEALRNCHRVPDSVPAVWSGELRDAVSMDVAYQRSETYTTKGRAGIPPRYCWMTSAERYNYDKDPERLARLSITPIDNWDNERTDNHRVLLMDHNPTSYSIYALQRNFSLYRAILGLLGYKLELPEGLQPFEWPIKTWAAEVFLDLAT